jgi:phosphotransferase system enzyme I (PtsI)
MAVKAGLRKKKIPFDTKTKLGLMIETPAAVCMAPELAQIADFFSVGTNDLVQYTTAVDRGNARLRSLQHYWHPALWRQLDQVVRAAHRAKIPVGICGEMSGDPLTVAALVGIGFDSLSFHPNSIPRVKSLLRSATFPNCRKLASGVVASSTSEKVHTLLKTFYRHMSSKSRA